MSTPVLTHVDDSFLWTGSECLPHPNPVSQVRVASRLLARMTGMLSTRNCEVHSLAMCWRMVAASLLAGAHALALRSLALLARWGGLRPPQTPPWHRAFHSGAGGQQRSGVHAPCIVPSTATLMLLHGTSLATILDTVYYAPCEYSAASRPCMACCSSHTTPHGRCRVGTFACGARGPAQRNWNIREGRTLASIRKVECTVLTFSFPHSGRASEHAQSGS